MTDQALIAAETMFLIIDAVIPKPTGGVRPIGLCPALVRMWGASRKAAMRQWHREYSRQHKEAAAAPEKDAADAVWQGMVRAELAAEVDDLSTPVVLFVMSKLVDTISWRRAADLADRAGCPVF